MINNEMVFVIKFAPPLPVLKGNTYLDCIEFKMKNIYTIDYL